MKYSYLFLLCSALSLSSCNPNSTDTNPNNALSSPALGSTFVYDNYYIDTNGVKLVNFPAFAEYIDTSTVLAIGIPYQGRSGVTNFGKSGNKGSFFLNYESSGDVSFYVPQGTRDAFTLH
ncbi:MAG: hypothetical protein ABI778_02575, partial [Ignavibacteriota bacterium]